MRLRAVGGWLGTVVTLVAYFESGHASTEFLNYSRQVPSENKRKFMRPEVFHVAFTNFPIDRVHSRRVNSDENFARLWLRTRRVFVLQRFRSAVAVNSNCFHGLRCRAGQFSDQRIGQRQLLALRCRQLLRLSRERTNKCTSDMRQWS